MILKDLETVGDKQLKKEVDETNGDRQLQAPVPLSKENFHKFEIFN